MNESKKIKAFIKNNEKYQNKIAGVDYVECAICGLYGKKLQFHIQMVHKLSVPEYKKTYNRPIVCDSMLSKQSESMKGKNNPGYNHGGKYSAFSDKFIGNTTKEEAIDKMKKTKRNNPQNENTKLEYYTSKGYSIEEAEKLLSERQSTFSLNKCIKKYGEEKGRQQWLERQEKWQSTLESKTEEEKIEINRKKYPKMGRISNAENEIYEYILKIEENVDKQFAIKSEENNWFYYDIRVGNKIIEYNGDYWHANPKIYDSSHVFKRNNKKINAKNIWEKDNKKILTANKNGYEVYVIWENEYKKDKIGTIEKCINFLTT